MPIASTAAVLATTRRIMARMSILPETRCHPGHGGTAHMVSSENAWMRRATSRGRIKDL
jgi:hypothetical protein